MATVAGVGRDEIEKKGGRGGDDGGWQNILKRGSKSLR